MTFNEIYSTYLNYSQDEKNELIGDHFLSSMPIQELIEKMDGNVPEQVKSVAKGLPYRNVRLAAFILKKLN